jgi:hypothetical protein
LQNGFLKVFRLFDDVELDRHIRSLQKLAPERRQSGDHPPMPQPEPRRPKRSTPVGVHFGTIATIHGDGRFAFVRADAPLDGIDADRDLFVFGKHVERGLVRGDRVTFNTRQATRKPHRVEAVDVRREA